MSVKSQIDDFINSKRIAIIGISSSKKFGNSVFTELNARGYELYPVHPRISNFHGVSCFRDIQSLPDYVESLYIVCSKENTLKAIIDANNKKTFSKIWIQQYCDSKDMQRYAKEQGMNTITGQCLLMHLDKPGGVHKFHRSILKFFRKFPK